MSTNQLVKIPAIVFAATIGGAMLCGLIGFPLAMAFTYGMGPFAVLWGLLVVGGAVLLPIFAFGQLVASYRYAVPATTTYVTTLIGIIPLWIMAAFGLLVFMTMRVPAPIMQTLVNVVYLFSFCIPALLATLVARHYRNKETKLA